MPELYPLRFQSIYKEKIWGGQKIKTVLGKDISPLDNCGESWELSGVAGNVSIIDNGYLKGKNLNELLSPDLLGTKIAEQFNSEFPLLIKFIDAAQDLSIQVHPDDYLAEKRHNGTGKSEMWYVIQADEGAELINGFLKNTDREEYLESLNNGKLISLLNKVPVSSGDVFYLPAGRVHTIGKGLLLAEIQQTSDYTYRIYDFDRLDKNGNKRELHTELAVDAIDFKKPTSVKSLYQNDPNQTNPVVLSPYFTSNKLVVTKGMSLDRSEIDCFKIYIGVGGSGKIANEEIAFGQVLLIPAVMREYTIEPNGTLELLETYVEL